MKKNVLNKLTNQRGAMFGLDARIAMAIFGLVAAASGVTFYNTIESARAGTLARELNAVEQAYTSFMFDTGSASKSFTDLTTETDPGIIGWQGPYFSSIGDNHVQYGTYSIVHGGTASGSVPAKCPPQPATCFIWVKLTGVPTEIALGVQEKFDGQHIFKGGLDENSSGKLRINTVEDGMEEIYYRISKR